MHCVHTRKKKMASIKHLLRSAPNVGTAEGTNITRVLFRRLLLKPIHLGRRKAKNGITTSLQPSCEKGAS